MVRELDRGAPTVGNSDYYPFACSVQICKHGVDVYSPTTVFVPYFKGLDSKGYRQDIPGWKVDDYPLESRPQIIYSPAPIDSFKHFPDSRTFHVMSNESNITDGQAFAYISYWLGAYFELYENLSRIIRGSAISIFSAGGKILGYIPSLESEITHQNKVTFLEHLIKDKGLWFISGGNLDEICDTIYDLSQK